MPFVPGLGGTGSGLGGVQTGFGGDPTGATGPPWLQTPFISVTAGGNQLDGVLGATVVMGLDVAVASATVELAENPMIGNNSEIVIVCGTGPHNVQRFRGLLKRTRSNLWPHSFTLICRGMLSRAAEFKQSVGAALPSFFVQALNSRLPIVGMSMTDILAESEATDENYVLGVLNRVPGLQVDPGDIGGTHHIFGLSASRELLWAPYTSALAQCQKLDEVCLGFRLFEGPSGRIFRTQVFGYPTDRADAQFTEGIDVLEATGERSIEDLINASYVEGYIFGGEPGLIGAYVAEENDFQSSDNPYIDPFSSPLIEDNTFAELVARWRLGERNRETVDISLVTFRDDLLIPGRTITVDLPHANVQEPVWIQHIEIQVRANPILFQQTIRGLGGGGTGNGVGSYSPPNVG